MEKLDASSEADAGEKVADELLALTRAELEPGWHYQAEKMADWIRLKAQIKARESGHLSRWAAPQ